MHDDQSTDEGQARDDAATVMPVLTGLRVVEFANALTAWCGRQLADLGADVVLVAPRDDDAPFGFAVDDPTVTAAEQRYFHANKRVVTFDADVADRDAVDGPVATLLAELAAEADVVLVSPTARTPVPGFDPNSAELAWAGADTIVCAVTPFGLDGPAASTPFTHLTAFANSGAMARVGEVGKPPRPLPGRLHFTQASGHAFLSVLAALAARDRVGAQWIDISAQEVEASHELLYDKYCLTGSPPGERSTATGIPPTGTWTTADGAVDIAAHQVRHWRAFLELLDEPEELGEPSLNDMFVRANLYDGLVGPIAALLAERTTEELSERGQSLGLPICPRNRPDRFIDDVQLHERGYLVSTGEPGVPPLPGPPIRSVPRLQRPEVEPPRPPAGDGAPWSRDERWASSLGTGVGMAAIRERAAVSPGTTGTAMPAGPDGALSGVKVLSLGAFIAGNVCAELLGSLGADVVKVESVSRPEVLRDPAFGFGHAAEEPSGAGTTPMFVAMTRNMRSLALEMRSPEGQAVFRELAATADVVIENFGTGVVERWGCGFDDLVRVNSNLVMVSLSGFGRTGPRSDYVAYGSNISNFTGLADRWMTASNFTDYLTATHSAGATIAALMTAHNTGRPVRLDAAQIEVFGAAAARLFLGDDSHDQGVFSHIYETAGTDRWAVVDVTSLDEWNTLCGVVSAEGLRVDTLDEIDGAAADELRAAIEAWGAVRTSHSAALAMTRAGIPAAAVAGLEDQCRDPQLGRRRFPVDAMHPDLGRLIVRGSPERLSRTPGRFDSLGPRFGRHSSEILDEWIGLTGDRLDDLVDRQVVYDTERSGPWTSGSD